jgi:ATP/maltotriose-dependent transcriptional regulator MalT
VIGIASQQPHRSNRHIADELVITLDTAKKHVLDKLGADYRTEAVTRGRQLGLIR